MKALKDSNAALARELQECKDELGVKSQQCKAAESQSEALQRGYSKLEERFEQVTGEIENWRGKMHFLADENTELLRQNQSLSQQAKQAKEEKTQLVLELQRLCYTVLNKYEFRDESAAMEAIGAAFNELRANCDSLREKEAAAAKRAEELDAEKDDVVGRFNTAVSCMREQTAAYKAERQSLLEERASQQSTISSLKAENESLRKFEQIAQTLEEDLGRAEEKNKSLEDALAAAKKEITPLEERERAAAMLLEKDTHIAQLKTKLKEMEERAAKLEHTTAATAGAAELLRESTEGLKAWSGLVATINLERERRENRIDCDSQTEDTRKVDTNVQTKNVAKVDCEAQTTGPMCDGTAEKLAIAQLEMNRLSVALQQLDVENESLRNNYTESKLKFTGAQHTCSTLRQEVKKLKNQMEVSNKEKEKAKEEIRSLKSLLASKEREAKELLETSDRASAALNAQEIHSLKSLLASKERESKELLEASDRASAALKSQNEKLTEEVSQFKQHMKSLHNRLLYQTTIKELNTIALEDALRAQRDQVDLLKNEIANLKKNTDAAPPVHKVVVSDEQNPAQVAAEKLAVVTAILLEEPVPSTSKGHSPMVVVSADGNPVEVAAEKLALIRSTLFGKPVPSTSKGHSPMGRAVRPPASRESKLSSSCGTAKDARPSNKALSGSPLKRTLGTDQDQVDHPVATEETAVTPLPPSAQSPAPQPVIKKRKFFKSSSGH